MSEYKNSIQLEVKIDSKNQAEANLQKVIENLNKNKINLDVEFKGDAYKNLQNLSTLIDSINSKTGQGITLGDFNKSIKDSLDDISKLSNEVTKVSRTNIGDGLFRQVENFTNGIGQTSKVTSIIQQIGDDFKQVGSGIVATTNDVEKYRESLLKIEQAQESLSKMKMVDNDKVADLKNILSNKDYISSNNELNNYLQQVKELEAEEKSLLNLKQKEVELDSKLKNSDHANSQKQAYSELSNLQKEEYSLKEKLISAEGEYKQKLEERLIRVNLLKNAQKQDINNNNLTNIQKENDLIKQQEQLQEQLNQTKAKNNDSVNASNLKAIAQETELLQKQEEAYKQIDVMKANGIVSNNDISKLEQMVKSAKNLQEMRNALNSIMNTSMMKESSILTLSKQLDNAQSKLDKMKTTFGNRLPDGFIESAESEINKLREDLTKVDGMNFNGIKNSLNQLGNQLESVSEEAKNSEGLLGRLGSSLKNIGIYFDAGDIFRGLINGAKEAVSYVTNIENSMVSLKRVVDDVSESEFKTLQNEIHDMAVATASSTADMVETVTDWKKLGYDLEQAKALAESSVKFDIAGDVNNIKTTTTDLISIIRGFGIENDKAVEKAKAIGDAINQLSNNYAVTSQDLADAMKRSSSALNLAGNSINESLSLATVAQEVNQSAEKVGSGLSTISMRLRGVSQDGEELDAKLGELVKNSTGVDMTMNGAFRSTYDILHDIAKVWNDGSLNDLTKANLAEKLFGKNQAKVGVAILDNFKQLDSTMLSLKDSANSVEEEFARSMDSTQAKMAQLKENIGGIFAQFVNSDMTKGVADGLNTFVVASGKVIKALGSIPTVITTVVGSLTVLNTKFRESMTSYQPTKIVELTKSLNEQSKIHNKETENINKKIIAQRAEIATQNQTGITYATSKVKLLDYQRQLAITTIKENACAIGAKALGVAFNMALGLGVGLLIQGLMGLVNASDTAKQKNEELLSSIKSLQSESTELSSLKDQYVSLKRELEEGNLTTEENKTKKEELSNIYNQLIQKVPELESALKLETTGYENQAKAIQGVIDLKNEEAGLKAEQYIKNNKITDDSVQTQIKNLASTQKELDKYSQMSLDPKYTDRQRQNYKNYATSLKESMLEVKQSLQETINTQDTLNKLNIDNGVNDKTIANAKEAISNAVLYKGAVENITEAVENNTKAKVENGNIINNSNDDISKEQDRTKAVQVATEAYGDASKNISQAQIYLDRLNKSGQLTPTLANQMQKAYKGAVSTIDTVTEAQDFLNKKIQEQKEIQENNYLEMNAMDEKFYADKIKNNDEFKSYYQASLNEFNADGEKAYDIDFERYKTYAELKEATQNDLGSAVQTWLESFVKESAKNYNIDFDNFKMSAENKAKILQALSDEISKVTAQMNSAIDYANEFNKQIASNDFDDPNKANIYEASARSSANELLADDLNKKIEKLNDAKVKVKTSFDEYNLALKGASNGGIGTTDFSGTGSGSKGSSSADKAKKDAEKEAEKAFKEAVERDKKELKKLTDAYDDAKNSISDNLKDIELNEQQLGKADNSNYVARVKLANDRIVEQSKALDSANQQLMALENTTMETSEGQQSLSENLKKATTEIKNQKLEVIKLQQTLQDLATNQIQKLIEKEKELKNLELEAKQNKQTEDLKEYTKEQEEAHNSRLDDLNEEMDALEKQKDIEDQEVKIAELKANIEEKKADLIEKQNILKQKQIDLERAQNQKTIYEYTKQEDGSYQFQWSANKDTIKSAKDNVDSAQKDVDSAKDSIKDSKDALSDYYDELEYKANKKAIQDKIDEENAKYKITQDFLSKKSEALSKQQETEKKQLEYHYVDIEKLSKDYLDTLNQQYGDNWEKIATTIDTNLTTIEDRFNKLNDLNVNYGLDSVSEAMNSSNLDSYIIKRKQSIQGEVDVTTEALNQQLSSLISYSDEMEKKKTESTTNMYDTQKDYSDDSTKLQNDTNATKLTNELLYLQAQNQITEGMLNTLHLIYDEAWGDIVDLTTLSTEEMLKQLQIMKGIHDKYIKMWNDTHKEDNQKDKVSISDNIAQLGNYKNGQKDYISARELLFGIGSNVLSQTGRLDTSGLSSISLGNNGLNALMPSTTNNSSSNVSNYYISDVSVNANDANNFLSSVINLTKQNAKTSK